MHQRHNAWHPRLIEWGEGRGEGRVVCFDSWSAGRSSWNRQLCENPAPKASPGGTLTNKICSTFDMDDYEFPSIILAARCIKSSSGAGTQRLSNINTPSINPIAGTPAN